MWKYNLSSFFLSFQDQGVPQSAPHSTRIALAVWFLISVILVCFYVTCITSFLTVPILRPIINSVDELAYSGKLEVAAVKSSIFEAIFLVNILSLII